MAGHGPPPKPNDQRRRRNISLAMTQLPAEGRKGDPPAFPLPSLKSKDHSRLELEIWGELWATPQAVAWERMRWVRDVAQYARFKAAAEMGSMKAAVESRHLGDRLGLTPQSLLRLRWEITPDEVGDARDRHPAKSRAALRIADLG